MTDSRHRASSSGFLFVLAARALQIDALRYAVRGLCDDEAWDIRLGWSEQRTPIQLVGLRTAGVTYPIGSVRLIHADASWFAVHLAVGETDPGYVMSGRAEQPELLLERADRAEGCSLVLRAGEAPATVEFPFLLGGALVECEPRPQLHGAELIFPGAVRVSFPGP